MEHRWSMRRDVLLDAVLYHSRDGITRCSVSDLSLNGMFVETREGCGLEPGAVVEAAFMLPRGGQSAFCRLHAKVARVTEEGAALTFLDFDLDALHSLHELYRLDRDDEDLPEPGRGEAGQPCLVFLTCNG